MKKLTIFFSWQSDLPNSTNRSFIEQALKAAIRLKQLEVEDVFVPVLDRDTSGVDGTPSITETIFSKIDDCALFVADVSLINGKIDSESKKTPNPNVLLELGYASAKIGWNRVICVMNTDYGKGADLPFDLKDRRWPIDYCLPQNATKEQKQKESQLLTKTFFNILNSSWSPEKFENLIDKMDAWLGKNLSEDIIVRHTSLNDFINLNKEMNFYSLFEKTPEHSEEYILSILDELCSSKLNNMIVSHINESWAERISKELTWFSDAVKGLNEKSLKGNHDFFQVTHDLIEKSKIAANIISKSQYEARTFSEQDRKLIRNYFRDLYKANQISKRLTFKNVLEHLN